jgi:hypothetical protein
MKKLIAFGAISLFSLPLFSAAHAEQKFTRQQANEQLPPVFIDNLHVHPDEDGGEFNQSYGLRMGLSEAAGAAPNEIACVMRQLHEVKKLMDEKKISRSELDQILITIQHGDGKADQEHAKEAVTIETHSSYSLWDKISDSVRGHLSFKRKGPKETKTLSLNVKMPSPAKCRVVSQNKIEKALDVDSVLHASSLLDDANRLQAQFLIGKKALPILGETAPDQNEVNLNRFKGNRSPAGGYSSPRDSGDSDAGSLR